MYVCASLRYALPVNSLLGAAESPGNKAAVVAHADVEVRRFPPDVKAGRTEAPTRFQAPDLQFPRVPLQNVRQVSQQGRPHQKGFPIHRRRRVPIRGIRGFDARSDVVRALRLGTHPDDMKGAVLSDHPDPHRAGGRRDESRTERRVSAPVQDNGIGPRNGTDAGIPLHHNLVGRLLARPERPEGFIGIGGVQDAVPLTGCEDAADEPGIPALPGFRRIRQIDHIVPHKRQNNPPPFLPGVQRSARRIRAGPGVLRRLPAAV